MKTPVDALLRAEAARFALRFACEDCAHFAPGSAGGTCGNGWPDRVSRSAIEEGELTFCKEFELGAPGEDAGEDP
jgi:hypothetical protein